MTKLKWIEIENFRGISHLQYEPKQVNLLIGRNNSGKTTILDAIYYNLTGNVYNDDMNKTKYNVKIGKSSSEIKSDTHKFTIYSSGAKLPENIQSNVDKILESSVIKTCKDLHLDDDLFQELYIYLRNKAQKFVYVYDDIPFIKFSDAIFVGFNKNNPTDFQKIILNSNQILKKYYDNSSPLSANKSGSSILRENSLPYSNIFEKTNNYYNYFHKMQMTSVEFMSKLEYYIYENYPVNRDGIVRIGENSKTGSFEFDDDVRIIDLENILKEYNIIQNLERLTSSGVVYKSDSGELSQIPYDRHGDGLQTLLRMIYMANEAKEGILLIEEPENHMHPGYLSVFVEQLMKLARELKIQVFITSHSYDLIDELCSYPENDEEKNMIQISRIVKRGSEHEIYNYTPDRAYEEMVTFKMDLRGT